MINVERVEEATPEIAINLGKIMPFLNKNHDGTSVDYQRLQSTVDSPSSAQFIATFKEQATLHDLFELTIKYPIVGAATLSTLHGVLGEKVWLEDFVVAPDAREFGVAQEMWDVMTEWRIENGLYQMRFNSVSERERAHGFYKRNGCEELAQGKTTLFVHNINN